MMAPQSDPFSATLNPKPFSGFKDYSRDPPVETKAIDSPRLQGLQLRAHCFLRLLLLLL